MSNDDAASAPRSPVGRQQDPVPRDQTEREADARRFPWQVPKEPKDDPGAPDRVQAAMANPSYRLAEEDADFLRSEDVRGPRLEIDYLKPELGLVEHGIGHAVVVLGGTRIPEPQEAQRTLERCRQMCAADPGNPEAQRACRVAERVVAKSYYYEAARDFARRVAAASTNVHGERVAIMTGGGPGVMEAANRGAWEVGSKSVGLNIRLPHEQYPNPYLTPGLCFQFHYFAIRKLHFMHRARALAAFPGGYGTLDELFEALVLMQTCKMPILPVVLVGRSFWKRVIDFDFLAEEGVIAKEDLDLFHFAETGDDAFEFIADWYRRAGRPIFG